MSDFVHLHLHSQFSLLDGANRLGDVVEKAKEAGMPAMALTDHGNMFGAIDFYNTAKKAGIKPIIGVEAYITPGKRTDRKLAQGGDNNHLVLLAQNETGYRNLLRLTSRAYLEGFYYKPRIDHELLSEFSEGLVGFSACLKGEINQQIMNGRESEAEAKLRSYLDVFAPGNFFLEMQDHGIEEQHACNDVLRRLARKHDVPLIATNDCHYLNQSDAEAHDVLLCIGTQRLFADEDRMRYASDNFYLKSADEMYKLFPNEPEALENTLRVAEMCDFELERGKFHLPEFPVPEGETLATYFANVSRDGLRERFVELKRSGSRSLDSHGEEGYWERLETEIKIIEEMGFPGYFLITWDFIRYARERDIPVGPGRGSAAGSLVSYALRITDIDPMRYDLLFERFLNPERISMPDIDIDFCMRRRGEVINYVTETYGKEHVAQIITFGTLAAKAAIRDVGRVLGVPYSKVDRVAKLVPDMTKSVATAAQEVPALKAEAANDPEIAKIIEIGSRLSGLTRHASVHAAGVVITPQPLEELVPLYRLKRGDVETVTTQWDKDVVEDLGLLKMDFLGLRTLTVIDDALKMVRRHGVDLDLDAVPLDDPEVYRLFREGRTNGIFQFESSGMKDLLRRAEPSKFEDLAAFNALYRPGALSVGMVEEYIQRKLGKKKVSYVLPQLEELLAETYGVIVYQEQVMLIAVEVAGFTLGQADMLRKAMGKKKAEVMQEQKKLFLDGAESRGVARSKADELWNYIEPFAGYGFNKSHSVAYAMLAFKTAYLKAHYPVAFMAAMLNSEMSSSDAVAKYIRECRAMEIEVLPPDVNESDWWFTAAGETIRFGIGAVKGIGSGAVEAILETRNEIGSFQSLTHMATEVDLRQLNQKVFESLVKAGCFDSLEPHRAALMAALERVIPYAQQRQKDIRDGQVSLFAPSQETEPGPDLRCREWPDAERLSYEKETLGFYLTGNPLSEHIATLDKLTTHGAEELNEAGEDVEGPVTLGGIVSDVRQVKIKSGMNAGRMMGRFVLEDLSGRVRCAMFANQFAQFGRFIEDEAVIIVKGDPRHRGSEVEVTVNEVVPLDRAAGKLLIGVALTVDSSIDQRSLLKLKHVLLEASGRIPVSFRVASERGTVSIQPPETYRVKLSPELTTEIEALLGNGTVRELYDLPPVEEEDDGPMPADEAPPEVDGPFPFPLDAAAS